MFIFFIVLNLTVILICPDIYFLNNSLNSLPYSGEDFWNINSLQLFQSSEAMDFQPWRRQHLRNRSCSEWCGLCTARCVHCGMCPLQDVCTVRCLVLVSSPFGLCLLGITVLLLSPKANDSGHLCISCGDKNHLQLRIIYIISGCI